MELHSRIGVDGVASWWAFLCGVGLLNIAAWALTLVLIERRRTSMPLGHYTVCRSQLLLSAVYVFGCAFRSALPVFDVPRLVVVNTWLSSVVVGRSVATVAELCFVAQWALMLRHTSRETGCVTARVMSYLVLPLIVIAEMCSWYSVLTTSNIGHVFEETLWGLSAALLVVSMIAMWPRCPPSWRPALIAGCVMTAAYVAYMFCVDVPMYLSRWLADEASGRQYLSFWQGLMDVTERRVVSHRWQDWKTEVMWMSLYFSVAVWISIFLIHAAARANAARQEKVAAQAAR
jgi:hypothetical protein